jgi:hypothetical protein
VVLIATPFIALPVVADAPASAATHAPAQLGPHAPLYCFPTDMDDALTEWKFKFSRGDINYYDYHVMNTATRGETYCYGGPSKIVGTMSADHKTCLYAGVATAVGMLIPDVGVVNAIYFFSTTCGIALLVD